MRTSNIESDFFKLGIDGDEDAADDVGYMSHKRVSIEALEIFDRQVQQFGLEVEMYDTRSTEFMWRLVKLEENRCEHGGDHAAPPNKRFCSIECAECDAGKKRCDFCSMGREQGIDWSDW